MKVSELISKCPHSEGYVVSEATDTDQPLTEEAVSNILPSHKAAMDLVRTRALGKALRIQAVGNVNDRLPSSRLLSMAPLWEELAAV